MNAERRKQLTEELRELLQPEIGDERLGFLLLFFSFPEGETETLDIRHVSNLTREAVDDLVRALAKRVDP